GQTRTLDEHMVLIEDAAGPTSIAGIMGGARSEVQPETRRVMLEAATWDGPNIHRTAACLGLRSEASARFEKGLQPEQCMHAQAVASGLMTQLTGARLQEGSVDEGWQPAAPLALRLREARVRAILGVEVPRERQAHILRALDLCRSGVARPPAAAPRARAAPRGADRQSALGSALDHAPHAARLAAGRGAPQRVPQPARRGAVRVRHGVPRVERQRAGG